jgi:hypothetical protein
VCVVVDILLTPTLLSTEDKYLKLPSDVVRGSVFPLTWRTTVTLAQREHLSVLVYKDLHRESHGRRLAEVEMSSLYRFERLQVVVASLLIPVFTDHAAVCV